MLSTKKCKDTCNCSPIKYLGDNINKGTRHFGS